MPNSNTIVIASGGTGGHLYPTIAVADEVKRLRPDIRIVFVGTHDRIESREVPRAGYEFFPIAIEAPGKSLSSMVKFPFKFAKAFADCMLFTNRERPRAMLGGGAYLSLPMGLAAWSFHVPIALLEINSVAGTANKMLARLSDQLFVSYQESIGEFPKRAQNGAIVCGTPVRGDLGSMLMSQEESRLHFGLSPDKTTVLVFGGSLGARAINDAMRNAAKRFVQDGYNVLWQTGKGNNIDTLQKEFAEMPNVKVHEYIYEMEQAYRASDLVICRAGASSLAELSRLGKPAILVPYPFAAANHQEKNALAFESSGAAVVLRDKELEEKLYDTALSLLKTPERRTAMSQNMRARENKEAAKIVAEWLIARTDKHSSA